MERWKIKWWLWIWWWNSHYQHQSILVRTLYIWRILKGRNGEFSRRPAEVFFSKSSIWKGSPAFASASPRADICRRAWTFGQEQCPLYSVCWVLLDLLMIATRSMAGLWVLADQDLSETQSLPSPSVYRRQLPHVPLWFNPQKDLCPLPSLPLSLLPFASGSTSQTMDFFSSLSY